MKTSTDINSILSKHSDVLQRAQNIQALIRTLQQEMDLLLDAEFRDQSAIIAVMEEYLDEGNEPTLPMMNILKIDGFQATYRAVMKKLFQKANIAFTWDGGWHDMGKKDVFTPILLIHTLLTDECHQKIQESVKLLPFLKPAPYSDTLYIDFQVADSAGHEEWMRLQINCYPQTSWAIIAPCLVPKDIQNEVLDIYNEALGIWPQNSQNEALDKAYEDVPF